MPGLRVVHLIDGDQRTTFELKSEVKDHALVIVGYGRSPPKVRWNDQLLEAAKGRRVIFLVRKLDVMYFF